jgi:hypothetical protein
MKTQSKPSAPPSSSSAHVTSPKTSLPLELAADISLFAGHVGSGLRHWESAGVLLVEMKKKCAWVFETIHENHPWITNDMLHLFYKIGTRNVWPGVLMVSNHHVARQLSFMPYEAQRLAVESTIPVVISVNGEGPTVVKRSVSELNRTEAERCFSVKGIVSVEDQAKSLQKSKPAGCSGAPRVNHAEKREVTEKKPERPAVGVVVPATPGRTYGRYAFRIGADHKVNAIPTLANPENKIRIRISDEFATVIEFYTL